MKRRHFLGLAAAGGLGAAAYRYWPDRGWVNPCLPEPLPRELARHPLVERSWEGIDPGEVWDCHVHLIGDGSSGSGCWFNPAMDRLSHPIQWIQKRFYLNASCPGSDMDRGYVRRLLTLLEDFPPGYRAMLLAFDHYHDSDGVQRPEHSAFYTPNEYARALAERHPERLEWIASIHPYRTDAVQTLESAARRGARAIKWLPAAQGMDPASPRCDPFYAALARLGLPLLTHAGAEWAVHGSGTDDLGNPLRLRRPLEHGVRVLVAHCASFGRGVDLDMGEHGPRLPSFVLFQRLMNEPGYEELLFGEIASVTQINRLGTAFPDLLTRRGWQDRLVYGSDYPLLGVMPLFSPRQMVRHDLLFAQEAQVLTAIGRYNPLLFDFVHKRALAYRGQRFTTPVFESRCHFDRPVTLSL